METLFSPRRYHLSLEDGLYRPALFIWAPEAVRGRRALLSSVVKVQTILKRHQFNFQAVLEYVYEHKGDLCSRL